MKVERKQRKNDYAALKRRIFLKTIIMAVSAVAVVFVLRRLSLGRMGNLIVGTLSDIFRIDDNAAFRIYQFGIRNYLEALYAVAIIIFVVIGFRLLIGSFEGYLNEITDGIDQLSGDQTKEIKLSPELGFVENRLLNVQKKLEEKDHQAKQSEQRKNDLVIYSAHDIRTPLTSSLGYLILLNGNPDLPADERKKYIGIALEKTRELDTMISELFEITRYNLHDISLEVAPIDLCNMFLQMKEEHYPLLQSGNKQMQINMDEDISVYGDAEKLARAFNNLLKNAVSYSETGSTIFISGKVSGDNVLLYLKNKCRPIPEEKLDRIFEQFYRLDDTRPANSAGAGLGLAIAKQIILLHHGTIVAENESDGIRFTVTLPLKQSE